MISSSTSHAEFLFHETLHQLPLDHDTKLKIPCRICQKSFSRQSLREHLRQHTNERIFECTVAGCPMTFTRKANLRCHIAKAHSKPSSATSPHLCPVCGKKFQSK